MNNQRGISALLLLFIATIALGMIGVILFFPALQKQLAMNEENNLGQTPMPTPTVTAIPTQTPFPDNFSETGNMIFDQDFSASEEENSGWSLLYEKPGTPALKVRLVFVPESKCYFGQTGDSCMSPFASGDRIKVEGRLVGQEVIISTMTRITGSSMIANPASVYCIEQGGGYEIVTAPDGSQSGNCVFPDGRKCDEWDFFRTNVCEK